MDVHLGGHLSWYDPLKRSHVVVEVAAPVPVSTIVRDLGLPPAEIAIVVVNGSVASSWTVAVSQNDRVEFFPPVGGGNG